MKKNPVILNLAKEWPWQLETFFGQMGAMILTETDLNDDVDVVITDQAEFNPSEYKNAKLISLVKPTHISTFLENKGRLYFAPEFMQHDFYPVILKKFLKDEINIHLNESYANVLRQFRNFKVMNHLSMGFHADNLAVDAFDAGFNLVSLRGFFDHAIYYFSYLKQEGLAGIPFEVDYGWNEKQFVLSITTSVKHFSNKYLTESLHEGSVSNPSHHLLKTLIQNSEFFDISFLEDPGKLTLTGFWSALNLPQQGFFYSETLNAAPVLAQESEKAELKNIVKAATLESIDQQEIKKAKLIEEPLPGVLVEKEKKEVLIEFSHILHEKFPGVPFEEIKVEDVQTILGDLPEDDFVHQLSDWKPEDLLDEVQTISGFTEEEDEIAQNIAGAMDEEVINTILGLPEEEEAVTNVAGTPDEPEHVETVKGQKEEQDKFQQTIKGDEVKKDNFTQTISGHQEKKDNFMSKISSSAQEQKGGFNVKIGSGGKKDVKDMVQKISGTLDNADLDKNTKQFIKQNANGAIEKGLKNFAMKIGVAPEDMNDEQIQTFRVKELPKAVSELLDDKQKVQTFEKELKEKSMQLKTLQSNMPSDFELKLKKNLEAKLKKDMMAEKVGEKIVVTGEQVKKDDFKMVVQSAVKETLTQEFKLKKGTKEEIQAKEEEIVKTLSKTLKQPEAQVKQLIREATEKVEQKAEVKIVAEKNAAKAVQEEKKVLKTNIVAAPAIDTAEITKMADQMGALRASEISLSSKLKDAEVEKKRLEKEVELLKIQMRAKNDADKKYETEIEQKAREYTEKKVSEEEVKEDLKKEVEKIIPPSVIAEEKRAEIIENIKAGKKLSAEDATALSLALEREQVTINKAKETELNFKKFQIESAQKDAMYKQEMNKSERAIKAKEVVVEKTKELMTAMVKKKEAEVAEAQKQVSELQEKLNMDVQRQQEQQIKEMQRNTENLNRNLELYKQKLQHLTDNAAKSKEENSGEQVLEENRNLQKLKVQLENKLNLESKMKKQIEDRLGKALENEANMRTSKTKADSEVREAQLQIKQLQEQLARAGQSSAKIEGNIEQKYKGQIKQAEDKLKLYEGKVKELEEKIKGSSKDSKDAAIAGGLAAVDAGSAKEKQLEGANKKLQADLTEIKNQFNEEKKNSVKFKAEATALKNKVTMLEKEVEKFKKKKAA